MKTITLQSDYIKPLEANPKQLAFARQYRGYTQTELCNNIKGLSQSNLSKYEKGLGTLSERTLKDVMLFLRFPFDFLYKDIGNTKFL